MVQVNKLIIGVELEALYAWFCNVKPVCFKCKQLLRWDQRRFWENQEGRHVYFFCDCRFNNPLQYLRFKWEILQEVDLLEIRIWYQDLVVQRSFLKKY